jgi:hypothetical protein
MGQPRKYRNNAAKQRAYRRRKARKRFLLPDAPEEQGTNNMDAETAFKAFQADINRFLDFKRRR